jgi:hypothetical protein
MPLWCNGRNLRSGWSPAGCPGFQADLPRVLAWLVVVSGSAGFASRAVCLAVVCCRVLLLLVVLVVRIGMAVERWSVKTEPLLVLSALEWFILGRRFGAVTRLNGRFVIYRSVLPLLRRL